MSVEFIRAIDDLVKEKGIFKRSPYRRHRISSCVSIRKNYGTSQNVRVTIDRETGDVDVLMRRNVVEEVEDEFTEISLEDALEIDTRYQVGDVVE